ncbi:DUF4406 domain-containing protein [Bacteroidales bacterium OttesenSCG-928-C19]|nr:DUF4406 domain-containing protein [Bacteroidales bacterium OttesenSCG-928-C19]
MKKKNCTYIAGKVTGLEHNDAWAKFFVAESNLMNQSKTVNPMRICDCGWSWWRCMVVCLWHLIFKCDRIYLLENWNDSKGAKIELFVALLTRKEIVK